jgi:hypothetical protein
MHVYRSGMNNDTAAMVFIVLFGVAAFLAGAGWQRGRMHRELTDLYGQLYDAVYERATSSMFKKAVRAASPNTGETRYPRPRPHGRAPAGPPPRRLEEDTTVVIFTPRQDREPAA